MDTETLMRSLPSPESLEWYPKLNDSLRFVLAMLSISLVEVMMLFFR